MRTFRLLPVVLLLFSSLLAATTAAATGNATARVAPWIALNHTVMQKLVAPNGTTIASQPSAGCSSCKKNERCCCPEPGFGDCFCAKLGTTCLAGGRAGLGATFKR